MLLCSYPKITLCNFWYRYNIFINFLWSSSIHNINILMFWKGSILTNTFYRHQKWQTLLAIQASIFCGTIDSSVKYPKNRASKVNFFNNKSFSKNFSVLPLNVSKISWITCPVRCANTSVVIHQSFVELKALQNCG